ncbi:MAG: hypothetical protein MJ252_29990, partial [archaeon]|nr:hypothetical protein [archaeon]
MDLLQQNMQIEESPQTTLLYFDTISSQKSQYNVEEIFFNKAVRLQQIRLLKTDSNPHPQIKSMKSETQKNLIYNFEVFARNLKKISDKFECVVGCCTANKDSGESDSIFPVYSELVTNHIVLRGTYEKITLCIYGIPFEGQENNILLENGRNEVPLEKLQEDEEGIRPFERPEEKFTLTPQDQNILSNWSIDKLLQDYLKFNYSNSNFIKGCYYINKPNIEMIEITKGGYIYYENELFQCGKALLNDYLRFIQNPSLILTESEIIGHQSRFKQIYEIIKNFLGKNKAYLEEDCCFRKENLQILSNQNDLIQIIIYSLNGSLYGDTEIKYGLKLLKLISNSENLSKHFIELNGMEMLYGILLRSEQTETAYPIKQYLPYLKFSNQNKSDSNKNLILIILCLECIYKLISYKDICNRFLDILDKKKISSVSYYLKEHSKENKEANIPTDFVIINNFSMPNTLGSSQEKKEDKKEKEKEKDKDKERDKKEKEKEK